MNIHDQFKKKNILMLIEIPTYTIIFVLWRFVLIELLKREFLRYRNQNSRY